MGINWKQAMVVGVFMGFGSAIGGMVGAYAAQKLREASSK